MKGKKWSILIFFQRSRSSKQLKSRDRFLCLFVDCISITKPGDYNLSIIFESEKNDVTLINIEPQSINAVVSSISET